MRQERSLVRDPLYTAVGEVAVTERTPEVSWRSVLQEDVETLVHLCWRCCSYRPHPACPHCADLVNHPSKRGFTQDTGCVLTLAWRYWLVALRSISPHTLRSASSCFKTWNNHKENWQCHSCSLTSVILTLQQLHSQKQYIQQMESRHNLWLMKQTAKVDVLMLLTKPYPAKLHISLSCVCHCGALRVKLYLVYCFHYAYSMFSFTTIAAYYKKYIQKVWACTHLFQFPCTFLYLCRWQINLNLNLQAVTATDQTVL